jgi:hypothetical protein
MLGRQTSTVAAEALGSPATAHSPAANVVVVRHPAVRCVLIHSVGQIAREPSEELLARQARVLLKVFEDVGPNGLLKVRRGNVSVGPPAYPRLDGFAVPVLSEPVGEFAQAVSVLVRGCAECAALH